MPTRQLWHRTKGGASPKNGRKWEPRKAEVRQTGLKKSENLLLCAFFFESPPTGATMALETIESEVAGTLWKIEVQVGEQVAEEDVLMILESMKMEIPVLAPVSGTVKEILVAVDDKIAEGQAVAVLES